MHRKLRLHARCHPYRSHLRAFEQLMVLLRPHIDEQPSPLGAEAMLFYGSPFHVNEWAPSIPNFDKIYRIGHFVWEADCLSAEQQRGLLRVDEVWTPSHYCWRIFHKYHPRVFWMPHVVTPPTMMGPREDVERIRKLINDEPKTVCFMSIGTDDLRKNYNLVTAAFMQTHAEFPNTRLILKHEPMEGKQGVITDGPITRLYERVSQGLIEALYQRADVYVSGHHSEGWGFTLSDAMARRVLTIAPAYGGNLEFMTPQNSILIPAREEFIGPSDLAHWFHPDMKWGHVSLDDMVRAMKTAYKVSIERRNDQVLDLAYANAMRFDANFGGTVAHSLLQNALETIKQRPNLGQ